MSLRRTIPLAVVAVTVAVSCAPTSAEPRADEPTTPFAPTVESLQRYQCPEWFRDAKFGVYVHWGVYSVAERGEWYARQMYQEGGRVYRYHVERFGHPSEFGYKDLIPLWKAENFDADRWLRLFKRAGAKYFTPCAVHHDGFALWDDDYQPYNAVDMGPRRDLIGEMRDATLRHGLRFGVTTHSARSLSWLQTAHGADERGPKAGVPYDGDDPAHQDLYLPKHHDDNRADTENPPTWWREYWLLRQKGLIDKYRPDFLYLDSAVPFAGDDRGRTGLRLLAYFYNQNAAWHGGESQAVLTHKGDKGPKRAPFFEGLATLDIERGKSGHIREAPWQTDDSIGPWGYNTEVAYKTPGAVVDKLIDIVSKNGNLLLNVPPKADGTFDEETIAILQAVGDWLAINGEAIYATRPWVVYGEGPDTDMESRATRSPYGAENVRFTQSKDGRTLYAIQLGWPDAQEDLVLTSLSEEGPGAGLKVRRVTMLGVEGELDWSRDASGLRVKLPEGAPDALAVAYRVEIDERE